MRGRATWTRFVAYAVPQTFKIRAAWDFRFTYFRIAPFVATVLALAVTFIIFATDDHFILTKTEVFPFICSWSLAYRTVTPFNIFSHQRWRDRFLGSDRKISFSNRRPRQHDEHDVKKHHGNFTDCFVIKNRKKIKEIKIWPKKKKIELNPSWG